MALKIAQLGQPVLRRRAKPVALERVVDPTFQSFLDEMIETMREAGGVGLAAPQVFSLDRVFLAAILPPDRDGQRAGVEVFVNPTLSELSPEIESAWEGCLSFLELQVYVPRHRSLRIDYTDRHGAEQSLKLSGFPARVAQHEFDHLEGILTIDRAKTTKNIIKASEADDAEPVES